MWKIDDFKNKMASSKNHNTVIRSPIFTTSSYGYKIRVTDVFIKKCFASFIEYFTVSKYIYLYLFKFKSFSDTRNCN